MDAMSDHEHDKQLRICKAPLWPEPALEEGTITRRRDRGRHVAGATGWNFPRSQKAAEARAGSSLLAQDGRAFGKDQHFEELLHRGIFSDTTSERDDRSGTAATRN